MTEDDRQADLAWQAFERVWHSAYLGDLPPRGPGEASYGYGCYCCPFASGGDDANPADPSEGHYDCALTGSKAVWGENPTCTSEQWKAKAMEAVLANRNPGLANTNGQATENK